MKAFILLVLGATAVSAATHCETAYAHGPGGICFKSSSWGWTNPLLVGTNVLDLYAGASQCDTSKGIHVGHIAITFTPKYDIASAEVHVLPPLFIQQTSAYVGVDFLPKDKDGKYIADTFPFKSPLYTESDGLLTYNMANIISTHHNSIVMFSAKVEACVKY